MWNVTKTKEFNSDIKNEISKRWSRASRRKDDLIKMLSSPSWSIEIGSIKLNPEDIIEEWMSRRPALKDLRDFIFSLDQENPEEKLFSQHLIKLYVDYIINKSGNDPYKMIRASTSNEVIRNIDLSVFKDESYHFLNTLFSCFPDAVIANKGLMTKNWKKDAFKPENIATTITGHIAGYQTYFITRYQPYLNGSDSSSKFREGLKNSFGIDDFDIKNKIKKITPDDKLKISQYFKKHVKNTSSGQYSIMAALKYGSRMADPQIKLLGMAGVFMEKSILKDMYYDRSSAGDRSWVLSSYIEHMLTDIKDIGSTFWAHDISENDLKIIKGDYPGDPDELVAEFISGFNKEEQVSLRERFNLNIDVINSKEGRRLALVSELGI